MEPNDALYLENILDFCNRIVLSIEKSHMTKSKFINDLKFQDKCAFRIEQIGEYVKKLSQTFKDNNPELPWHLMVGFRNIVAHDYGTVDMNLFWDIIKNDIPPLRNFCINKLN